MPFGKPNRERDRAVSSPPGQEGSFKCEAPRSTSGFTLIEVLVSFTLLTMIGAIVVSAVRSGVASTSKGTQALNNIQQREKAFVVLEEQLRSVVPTLWRTADPAALRIRIGFDGDRRRIRFVSRYSAFAGPLSIPRWVELEWTDSPPATLRVKEFRVIPPNNAIDAEPIAETDLLPVADLEFEYLRRARGTDPARWLQTWRSDEQAELPAAVRVVSKGMQSTSFVIPLDAAAMSWQGLWLQ